MRNGYSTSPQEEFLRCILSAAWPAMALLTACNPNATPQLQGYIEGEYVRVAAPFAGRLQQLAVHRGDTVAAGAPLFALERENEDAARREAAERMRAAEARLADLRTGKRPTEVASVGQQLQRASATRDLSAAQLRVTLILLLARLLFDVPRAGNAVVLYGACCCSLPPT